MTAYEWICQYLDQLGSARVGQMWQCPAHVDPSPSLSIGKGQNGCVLMHCFAGCPNAEILAKLHLEPSAFFDAHPWSPAKVSRLLGVHCEFPRLERASGSGSGRGGKVIRVDLHAYTSDVRLARERLDTGGKRIKWEYRGRDGMWYPSKGADMTTLPLYREHEVRAAILCGERVVLCESESSVDALNDAGISATTWAGGADAPRIERLVSVLRGADVLWVPDNDPAGLRCDTKVQEALLPHVGRSWRLIGAVGEDARDLVNRDVLNREYLLDLR